MSTSEGRNERREWLGVLARMPAQSLASALSSLNPLPPYRKLKPSESGLIMARGRIGGDGGAFNLGEVAVSRCAVAMEGGVLGVGYVLGRDLRKAETVAVLDALLQQEAWHERVMRDVVIPETGRQAKVRSERSQKVAATRVNFFTMVRGE